MTAYHGTQNTWASMVRWKNGPIVTVIPIRIALPRTTWLTFPRTSWSHDKGVPGKVVAQLMGHANVDTRPNVYTQVVDRSLRNAVETIGGVHHCPQTRGRRTVTM